MTPWAVPLNYKKDEIFSSTSGEKIVCITRIHLQLPVLTLDSSTEQLQQTRMNNQCHEVEEEMAILRWH